MIVVEQHIDFRTLRNLLYAAYIAGQMSGLEGKLLDHQSAARERQKLIELLTKEVI